MTDLKFAALVRDIEPLRACFIVEASSGALHREFRRGAVSVESEALARAVAGLARVQTDIVGHAQSATLTTLEWPTVTVIVRSVSEAAVVVFFFEPDVSLGLLRMHITRVIDGIDADLPVAPGGRRWEANGAAPSRAASRARKLLDYLEGHAPDTHAALLRVSLQTGLPMSLLQTPERLSGEEFDQVTASVRRILGVEQLPV